jgi:ABC-type proline/glycine betaine transport system substrate-binding protein
MLQVSIGQCQSQLIETCAFKSQVTVMCEAWQPTHKRSYRYRYCDNTVYVTVSRVNAYSGGVLAKALPGGLRYLST